MIEMLQATLSERTAPIVQGMNMRVVSASTEDVVVALPVTPHVVNAANALCGQAIMAAMDTVLVLAIFASACGLDPALQEFLCARSRSPRDSDAGSYSRYFV